MWSVYFENYHSPIAIIFLQPIIHFTFLKIDLHFGFRLGICCSLFIHLFMVQSDPYGLITWTQYLHYIKYEIIKKLW